MQEINISESGVYSKNISYLLESLVPKLEFCHATSRVDCVRDRTNLTLYADELHENYLRDFLTEKISEIICISYKNEYLQQELGSVFLDLEEKRLLLVALIAADLKEEREYVGNLLQNDSIYQFDGFFRFRLASLRKKWSRICASIPAGFNSLQLDDFIFYLLEECQGSIYLKDNSVFNEEYQILNRRILLNGERNSLRYEILLSGASRIVCLSELSAEDSIFLGKYYKEKLFFS